MNIRYLLPFGVLLGGAAQGAPLANLVLACPDESAINQPFDACHGYIYEIPTNERIVVSSSHVWRKAADLAASELLLVCTIPVEPGAYSSCRDAAGVRRTAFVRKDSVIAGGQNSVIVSKTGGDYADPVTAAENAFAGDTWCAAPHWPDQPCVMAIGEGVFILPKTLSIPQGLAVSGNGKGATMLVADNGVETAVSLSGNVRISDLTIVNSQPGGGRTTGVKAERFVGPLVSTAHLSGVGIHVAGAAQNVAVVKSVRLEIFGSDITAVGQDAIGISGGGPADPQANVTLERSHLSAEVALDEQWVGQTSRPRVQLIDSHVFGAVSLNHYGSRLEIVRSGILGNVTAKNQDVRVVITDSSIRGNVDTVIDLQGVVLITNTNVEGNLATVSAAATFDGLRLHGELSIERTRANKLLRSHVINSAGTAPAISLRSGGVHLEHTFVQGPQAVAADSNVFPSDQSELDASSSVLAGRVSTAAGAVFNCTDTYGADYELLSASCQPQTP